MKLIFLLLVTSSSAFAQEDCRPSLYQHDNKPLCYSTKLRAYFTQSCALGKCEAMTFLEKKSLINLSSLPKGKLQGEKTCEALGGKAVVVSSPKTKDQFCLCLAKDSSGVSCSNLGLR